MTGTGPLISLEGKVALVTGGGGGIGRAAALSLAGAGADVAVIDVVPERCDEVVALVEGMGRRALGISGNVMDVEAVTAAVETTAAHFGRFDVLVNNAGGVTWRPFAELKPRNWQRHIDMNLTSNLAATSAAIPHMIAAGGGSIIAVTSIEASRAAPGYAVYAACKAGINNLTRTLALELAEHGIRVNAIAPDSTATPGMNGVFDGSADPARWPAPSPERQETIRRRIPLGRQGTAGECGDLIAFLASPLASYITGTIIPIDGGTWAGGGWIRDRAGKWVLPPDLSPAN
ncbi:NAD(P)-dependent dehydrogenase, short-chain alcohol dehydrogenase family [Novosphingobium sp. CF614]|uniref:SDR family NAD(P)-dependent oxidoreductase n=1 Tax=Novosphingobium sp. CF614 TaxID=1884364 RepID=UPI0008E9F876|nr:SDR family NAD(P)-dependent oxidoreductase [Novosphingobium sp. CF614]SFF77342.1 NAD(P)-dependent dehydrogenase, short-chain alcohol dehydrogenase family [Novosphingobium sp. CF614]